MDGSCLTIKLLTTLIVSTLINQATFSQSDQDLYDIATGHYARGAWQFAEETFVRLADEHPESELTRESKFFLGETLIQLDRPDDALQAFRQYESYYPQHKNITRCQFRIAECYYLIDKDVVALRKMQDFVFEHPNHALCEYALPIVGNLRLERNEPQIAERAFRIVLQRFPNSAQSETSRLGLARSLYMQGRHNDAAKIFRELADNQQFEKVDHALFALGKISYLQNHSEAASGWLVHLTKHFPNSPFATESNFILAKIKANNGEFEQALKQFKALEDSEVSAELAAKIRFERAIAYRQLGNIEECKSLLEQIIETNPLNGPQESTIDRALIERIRIADSESDWQTIIEIESGAQEKQVGRPYLAVIKTTAGIAYYRQNKFDSAITKFQQASQLYVDQDFSQHENLKYWTALSHLGLQQFEPAKILLDEIDILNKSDQFEASIALAQANVFVGTQQFDLAIPKFRQYLRLLPEGHDSHQARISMTKCQIETGDYLTADRSLDTIWQRESNISSLESLAINLAWAAGQNQDWVVARKWYSRLVTSHNDSVSTQAVNGLAYVESHDSDQLFDPESIEAIVDKISSGKIESMKAGLILADSLSKQGQTDAANRITQSILEQWRTARDIPEEIIVPTIFSISEQLTDQDNFESITQSNELLEELLDQESRFKQRDRAQYQLAWGYLKTKQRKRSVDTFEQLVSENPTSKYREDSLFRIAKIALDRGDQQSAKRSLNQLVASEVKSEAVAFGLYQLGKIAIREGNWPDAKTNMCRLVDEYPNSSVTCHAEYWLAESSYQTSDFETANTYFESVVNQNSQPDNRRFRSLLRVAQIKTNQKRWNLVELIYDRANEEFANHSELYQFDYLMGRRSMDQGKFERARAYFSQVVEIPDAGSIELAAMAQWMIGETYFHQEDYKQAIEAYFLVERQHAFTQWQSAALFQAAKCYEHLDQIKPASKLYQHVIQIEPESDYAIQARKRLGQSKTFRPASFQNSKTND